MALLWDASLTDAGVSMISQWAQGTGNKLTITGAVIGEGVVAATQLHTLTQLTDQKSTISIQGFESVANGVKLKLRKTSQGITTSFILNQIGIYAKLDTSGGTPIIADSLIAVYQQDTGVLVPTEADSPDFVFTFYGTVQTNYQGDLTINVDTSAILSQDDIADNLVTADATMTLSANMGVKIADNLAANEENGAKNKLDITANSDSINGITFTVNPDKTITVAGTASADVEFKLAQLQSIYIESNTDYILSGCPTGGAANKWFLEYTNYYNFAYKDTGDGVTVNKFDATTYPNQRVNIVVKSGTALPVGGITFKPMLRDARIIDPTFVPYAKTNKQLTDDKAERADLSAIHATGSTNTTGAQINAGAFFYLNNQFCKALTNIAANATFTENTNYKKDTVGEELITANPIATRDSSVLDAPNTFKDGITIEGTYTGTDYPLNYGLVVTLKSTSNRVYQVNFGPGATYIRSSTSATTWGSWYSVTETVVS